MIERRNGINRVLPALRGSLVLISTVFHITDPGVNLIAKGDDVKKT